MQSTDKRKEKDYRDRFRLYMKDFPPGWDKYPVRVARCVHCDGLTMNPQNGLCACGAELHPSTRTMLPGLTYYPGQSGGDEPRKRDEGPQEIVLCDVPYRKKVDK